jgi:hypothetical protein
MNNNLRIQYDTAKLNSQWLTIAKSRLEAFRKIFGQSYFKATGLNENDPPELWRFAVGLRGASDLTEDNRARELADSLGSLDPQFMGHPDNYKQFREALGKPTLRDTVLSLAQRVPDDAELSSHLSKLLMLYKQGPIPPEKFERAGADKTTRFLIEYWIEDPPSDRFLWKSLCFYSDRPMAKLIYFLKGSRPKKWLPCDKVESEAARIKKLYQRLGLVPARPRAIRDIMFKRDQLCFVPYEKAAFHGN